MNLTQRVKPSWWESMADQIEAALYSIIFEPIQRIINKASAQMKGTGPQLLNASDSVLRMALRTGRVQYAEGKFSGLFSASISKVLQSMGAVWDKRSGIFKMNPMNVPGWVMAEAGFYNTAAQAAHDEIKRTLNFIEDSLDEAVDKEKVDGAETAEDVFEDFESIADKLRVMPTLTAESKAKLIANYNQNMKLWIKKFSKEEIVKLRARVERNAMQGNRFSGLIDEVKARYGVSKSKATFLARNETSIFMSKFRELRFKEAGVQRYRWSTSHDERVRDDHKRLDGKIFFYDQPPIVDLATGRRANPGQDFMCRCVDIPILDPVEAMV